MQVSEMTSIISTIGFPIFITLYVLVRLEAKMDTLNESILKLTSAIKENPQF